MRMMAALLAWFFMGVLAVLLIVLIPFGAAFVIVIWTGEALRYFFSFGRYKPTWGIHAFMKTGLPSELVSQLSMYLGTAFWLLVVVLVKNW